MTAKLLSRYKMALSSLELVPADKGCFEVKLGDELLYSKLATGKFPDEMAIVDMVGSRVEG